jgi:energy-coupling factor transporter transmembrane protein EcfT
MMTRNRLLFAGLFVASVVFLYFYGGKIPYLFFNLLLGMFSISLLYTIFVFFRFKFTQDIDKKLVMKGDKVNFLF